jgi:hypothetical protein
VGSAIEKGLPQRFLWLIPQPSFSSFESLEPVDETFYDSVGNYFNEIGDHIINYDLSSQADNLPCSILQLHSELLPF